MMFLAVQEDQVTPGVVAFFIIAALGVTLFFLIRSMNKQIGRIDAPSEEDLRQADWERRQAETRAARAAERPDTGDADGTDRADADDRDAVADRSGEARRPGQNDG